MKWLNKMNKDKKNLDNLFKDYFPDSKVFSKMTKKERLMQDIKDLFQQPNPEKTNKGENKMNNQQIVDILNKINEIELKIEEDNGFAAELFEEEIFVKPYIFDEEREKRLELLYAELEELNKKLNEGE